ncbi:MAG: hypothetical protein WKG01_26845 [Kofleriaceae bacterium]
MRPLVVTALCGAALLGFAANSLLGLAALGGGAIDATSFIAIRICSGALVLAVLVALARRPAFDDDRHPGSWASGAALWLYAAAFSFAYLWLTTATGALILFASVQVTMFGWSVVRGDRPRPLEWLGLAIAAAGLVALTLPGLERPDPVAAAMMALAGISWGIYTLRGRGAALGSAMTALAGAARCDHAARDPAGRRSRLARRRDPRRDLGRGRLRRWLQPVVRGAATARTDPRGGGAAPGAGDRGDRWRRAARRADHDAPAGCGRRDRRRHRARRARATPRLKAARPPVRTVE